MTSIQAEIAAVTPTERQKELAEWQRYIKTEYYVQLECGINTKTTSDLRKSRCALDCTRNQLPAYKRSKWIETQTCTKTQWCHLVRGMFSFLVKTTP